MAVREPIRIAWTDDTRRLIQELLPLLNEIAREINAGGSGAPAAAEYLVGALHAGLSAERLVTDTATIAWDLATAGQAKANFIGAAGQGAMGPPGMDGGDGEVGSPGPPGAVGAAGSAGAQGSIGVMGPPGSDGVDGESWAIPGPIGAAGANGSQGLQGPAGPPGPAGEDGETGPMGPPGQQGVAGGGGVTPRRVVGVSFDGSGSTPTVGAVGYLVCPFNGTIDQWHMVADASGSAVVDVWKAAGAIPTNANTIAGAEKPTLSAQQLSSDVALGTWTTAVTAGDVFGFEIESVATCTRLTVEVRISEAA